MIKPIDILILEHEPFILDLYKNIFNAITINRSNKLKFNFKTFSRFETNYRLINNSINKNKFDLCIISSHSVKGFNFKRFLHEELVQQLKRNSPTTKIVYILNNICNFRINLLLKRINPDGLIIRNEVDSNELRAAFQSILNNSTFYSRTILHQMRRIITNDLSLDSNDELILLYLSHGIKNKDLPNYIPLSIGGIERRKRILKETFRVKGNDDKTLIKKAKQFGLI